MAKILIGKIPQVYRHHIKAGYEGYLTEAVNGDNEVECSPWIHLDVYTTSKTPLTMQDLVDQKLVTISSCPTMYICGSPSAYGPFVDSYCIVCAVIYSQTERINFSLFDALNDFYFEISAKVSDFDVTDIVTKI